MFNFEDHAEVIIISAFSGAGKSTFASHYVNEHCSESFIVSADDTQRENAHALGLDYDNGGEGFDPALLAMAHPTCYLRFLRATAEKLPLILVDNTNLSKWEISPYVLGAEAHGYNVRIIRLVCDPDVAFARQRHGVPYAVIRNSETGAIRKTFAFGDKTTGENESVVGGFCAMVDQFNERDVLPWWNVESRNTTPGVMEAIANGSISFDI